MEREITGLAKKIIDFEKEKGLTDTDLALESHLSVEQIHNIKSMNEKADSKTENLLNSIFNK